MEDVPGSNACVTIREAIESPTVPMFDPAWKSRRSRSTSGEGHRRRDVRARLERVPAGPLWVLVVSVVVGDLVSTVYGLGLGLHEQNPVVAEVIASYGIGGLVGLKLLTLGSAVVAWLALERHYGVAVLAGLALPQGGAVVVNVVTILSLVA